MSNHTFDVFYCGQLRFVEVIDYHKNFIEGCSNIGAVITPLLLEKPELGNISVRYSVEKNKSYQDSIAFLRNRYTEIDLKEVDENEILNHIDKNHLYRLSRLFLFLKYYKSTEDFTVVLTTDTVFRKPTTVKRILSESIIPEDMAVVVAQKSKQPYLGECGFFILNRLASEKIKKVDMKSILNILQNEKYESPDEIWTDFFRFLGITFLPIWPHFQSQRFKPNMELSDLNDEPKAIKKMIEYYKYKKNLYDQRKQ